MRSLDTLIRRASDWTLDRATVSTFCAEHRLETDAFYNEIALEIARRFDHGTISYDDADVAMNRIYEFMIADAADHGDGFELAEPAFSIYLAFDEGEFDHGDGNDPIETFTRPAIRRVLDGDRL